jgi:hypothetical protein
LSLNFFLSTVIVIFIITPASTRAHTHVSKWNGVVVVVIFLII